MISRLAGDGRGRRTYPFPIAVFVLFVRGVEVHSVEAADCEREDHLDEAEDGEGDVCHGHLAAADESHLRSEEGLTALRGLNAWETGNNEGY
jgi:hypothetical protein